MDRCPGADRPPLEGIDDPAITTYGRLLEVTRRFESLFAATIRRTGGLAGPRFEVLLRLGRSPGEQLTMSQLAAQLGVTSGGATRLVDRVVADGLVERRACTEDRRVNHVGLTERGRERLAEGLAAHRADLARELTARLSAEERAELDRLLDRLRDPAGLPDEPAEPVTGSGARPRASSA